MSSKDEVILGKPNKEEIDRIIADMVAQVKTRGMFHKKDGSKVSSFLSRNIIQRK